MVLPKLHLLLLTTPMLMNLDQTLVFQHNLSETNDVAMKVGLELADPVLLLFSVLCDGLGCCLVLGLLSLWAKTGLLYL